ncbi:hypothetical protein [uncultured Phenylobacterium sp.]|uniref:hypothetical protein n=1 Tax=uncultured Phenylobacterium sp. TaxID=349273 RepID=UPI0025D5AAD4|nr:hypothetical protein [uncultured Phenylobacterium sp.]
MTRTITRLFDTHTQAMAAVTDLEAAGIDHDRISLVANNSDNWHDGHEHEHGHLHDNEAAEGASKGATTGGIMGGVGGLLAGLGMLAIPGLGPVVAAGWLASTAVGALAGAAVGGATGGLLGALKDAGHTDDEAQVYAEGVRRGGTLVSVKADDDDAGQVERILDGQAGIDAVRRGQAYRQDGWTGFDANAPELSADEVVRERSRYASGEPRSFGGRPEIGGMTDAASQDAPREPGSRPATRSF